MPERASKSITILLVSYFSLLGTIFADTIVMANNQTFTGIPIQTNGNHVLILTHYAAFNFSATDIKEIRTESDEVAESSDTNRLPNFEKAVLLLSEQPWATNLAPIPATVIDKGILRNVPYTSLRCGQDYEVNVYGDLENPSGVEIGVYRKLIGNNTAKDNCFEFISTLLKHEADKQVLRSLDRNKDLKTRDELTFEITPSTAEDAYNGWWVSVYSEEKLNLARASDDNMKLITTTRANAVKDGENNTDSGGWSTNELAEARPSPNPTITFVSSSGEVISNAEVVRVIDGVGLIWQQGSTSEGMVRLADLPKHLRVRFGYDEAKTKAADELAEKKNEAWQQAIQAAAEVAQTITTQPDSSYSGDSGEIYSGGGSVYVHGYERSNGTYVNAYTRSSPSR